MAILAFILAVVVGGGVLPATYDLLAQDAGIAPIVSPYGFGASSMSYDGRTNAAAVADHSASRATTLARASPETSRDSVAPSGLISAPRAIGPAGNPGALTSTQRGQYLFDNWHPATFPNRTQSINYHLAKHGNGRTAFEYTRDAQQFFSQNRNLATEVILRDGTPGLRIQTKVPLPGGGTNNVGGFWTSDGRLVTFWG